MFNLYSRNNYNANTYSAPAESIDPYIQTYPFKNVPLNYPYNALEPFIDENTMHLHHDKHLQTYIDNLNKALEHFPQYQGMLLTDLINTAPSMEEPLKTQVLRNAGGVFNHFFYFDELSPQKNKPSGAVLNLIDKYFSSIDNFIKQFSDAALSVFGSGYAWLAVDEDGIPKIVTTKNQMTPLSLYMTPLLNIDMWEHAYYLKHYNDRAAYVKDWLNVINWDRLNSLI